MERRRVMLSVVAVAWCSVAWSQYQSRLPVAPKLMEGDVEKFLSKNLPAINAKIGVAKRGSVRATAPAAAQFDGRSYVFRTQADKDAEVERLKSTAGGIDFPTIFCHDHADGQVGSLNQEGVVHRVQSVSDGAAMVRASFTGYHPASGTSTPLGAAWTFSLESPGVSALRAGQEFSSFPGVWKVGGGGDALEPFDAAPALERVKKKR